MKNNIKSVKQIFLLNLFTLTLFGVSILLSEFVKLPQNIFGLFVLFLPAINSTWILESLSRQKLKQTQFILWSIYLMFGFSSIPTLIVLNFNDLNIDKSLIILTQVGLSAITALTAITLGLFKKSNLTSLSFKSLKPNQTTILIALGFLTIQFVHFYLYPFLPEADGYTTLAEITQSIKSNFFDDTSSRPLFEPLILTINSLSLLDLFTIYKIGLPLFFGVILIPFYQLAKPIKKYSNILFLIAVFSPLLLPVIQLESLYTRTQSVFLISFPILVYLISERLKEKTIYTLYWFLCVIFTSALMIKFHQYFFALIPILILISIYFSWPWLKKISFEQGLIGALLAAFAVEWILRLGLLDTIFSIINRSVKTLSDSSFDPWFIDSYVNVDGNQLGWPGYSWLLYYGYNFGLVLPFLFLFFKKIKLQTIHILVLISISGFFLVAEVLPRFGLAYLPDRAIQIFVLGLSFLIPFAILKIAILKSQYLKILVVFLAVATLFTSWSLTYAKQGRVSASQVEMANFIKDNTSPTSIFITQPAANAIITYYAERDRLLSTKFFTEENQKEKEKIISNISDTRFQIEQFIKKDNKNDLQIKELMETYISYQSKANNEPLQGILSLHRTFEKTRESWQRFEQKDLPERREVYIVFSYDFFDSLYGQRAWWQEENSMKANLEQFDNAEIYEKIYDYSGEYIWKVDLESINKSI